MSIHGIPEDELTTHRKEAFESASLVGLQEMMKIAPEEVLAECLRREKRERQLAKDAMLAKDASDCLSIMSALYSVIGQIVALNPWLLDSHEVVQP